MTELPVTLAPGLSGALSLPDRPSGLVLLLGATGDHREQGRLRTVAGYLRRRDFATLQVQPESPAAAPAPEAATADAASADRASRVPPLAHRLLQALGGLRLHLALSGLPIGLYGSGVAAAAAAVVAAERPDAVRAVVAQSGHVELAGPSLSSLKAPLLMIVGGYDTAMFEAAREVARTPGLTARVELVARATQLFEEAGALERVAMAAGDWFERHLRNAPAPG